VDAGSAGSLVAKAEADELAELEVVCELAAPVEDDDAIVEEPVELVVVVEEVLSEEVLELAVEEVVEDDVDFVEDVEDALEDDEEVVEDDEEVVELVVEAVEEVVVEEEDVDEVELVILVDVDCVDADCAAIVKYAVRVMLWVSVTVCAWSVLPPLHLSKT
jgi:hypothetical protein